MKKNYSRLSITPKPLEISILIVTTIMISVNPATAKPACYLMDANGLRISLNHLCGRGSKPPQTPTQVTTADTPVSTTPIDESSISTLDETQTQDIGIVGSDESKRQQREELFQPETPSLRDRTRNLPLNSRQRRRNRYPRSYLRR